MRAKIVRGIDSKGNKKKPQASRGHEGRGTAECRLLLLRPAAAFVEDHGAFHRSERGFFHESVGLRFFVVRHGTHGVPEVVFLPGDIEQLLITGQVDGHLATEVLGAAVRRARTQHQTKDPENQIANFHLFLHCSCHRYDDTVK